MKDDEFAGLAAPAKRALAAAGYARLDQLDGVPEADLAKLHGLGPNGLKMLKARLAQRELSLR